MEILKRMRNRVTIGNRYVFLVDLLLIVISVFGSFGMRLEFGGLFLYYLPQALMMSAVALLIKPLVYRQFGLYRRLWAYASTQELFVIVAAVTTASVFVSLGVILVTTIQQTMLPFYRGFPRSVLAIDWLLSLVLIGGFRFALRVLAENQSAPRENRGRVRRVLIVGAGEERAEFVIDE